MSIFQPSPAHVLASFYLKSHSPTVWLISGGRGAGKTTWCQTLVQHARQAGLTTGGILSPGHFENGRKTSFDLINLLTDERRSHGRRLAKDASGKTIGCWQLDEAVTQWANEILAASSGVDTLFVDELGPMEFEKGEGFQAGLKLLDEGAFGRAFVVVRPELLQVAQARWSEAGVVDLGEGVRDFCT